jgi:tetratricopeptide (TPR) repeat protein
MGLSTWAPGSSLHRRWTRCQAIQNAHQKGIIHRDIKPSNVLVTSHDGKPMAKVIDFGVAKAIHQHLTERTIYTQFAQMIGTPLYMSPEQAEMSGLDLDTRSDIYSLGVLLYELLTGSTPLERKRIATAAYDEIRRMIREEEPPIPSQRLSTSDTLPSMAASRRTEPAKLSRMLKGELDWVVMKALEKDRTRRYETASGLARDIQRYLADELVEARPASAGYRLRKFARKHRAALSATALIALLLVAGVAVSAWQAVRAWRAERTAVQERDDKQFALEAEKKARAQTRDALDEMSSRLMEEWLFRQPRLSPQQQQYLEKVAAAYQDFAADSGQDELSLSGIAEARVRLAGIMQTLGRAADAVKEGERAEAVFRTLIGQDPSSVPYRKGLLHALLRQVHGLQWSKTNKEIEPLELQALAIADQLVSEAPEDVDRTEDLCRVLINRAYHLHGAARFDDGLAAVDRALPLQDRLVSADRSNDRRLEMLALIHNNREVCLEGLDRKAEANRERAAAQELFETIARRSPANHRARFNAGRMRLNAGMALKEEGEVAKAVIEYRKAEEWMQPVRDEFRGVNEYLGMLGALYLNWARALVAAKDWPAATEMGNRALEIAHELAQ